MLQKLIYSIFVFLSSKFYNCNVFFRIVFGRTCYGTTVSSCMVGGLSYAMWFEFRIFYKRTRMWLKLSPRVMGGYELGSRPFKSETHLWVFSVTYSSKLSNAISIYYRSHFLPTKMKLVVWAL